jgi:hypothetical protein
VNPKGRGSRTNAPQAGLSYDLKLTGLVGVDLTYPPALIAADLSLSVKKGTGYGHRSFPHRRPDHKPPTHQESEPARPNQTRHAADRLLAEGKDPRRNQRNDSRSAVDQCTVTGHGKSDTKLA